MIPLIGFIAALMSCGFMLGTQGTNKYGEVPTQPNCGAKAPNL